MAHKISVIGAAGRVGETAAQVIAQRDLCQELALFDIHDGRTKGTALDIAETGPLFGFDTNVVGGNDPAILADSDILVVTAGFPRKPGMTRQDLLSKNVEIIDNIAANATKYAPNAIMIIVSNPVDIITYRAFTKLGWDRSRVFGQAGVLDSARMATFLAEETGFSTKDIQACVLGGHGDTMVPMLRYTTVSGIPVENFIAKDKLDAIVDRTRHGGAEVLGLKENSSAYQAPGTATADMVEAIVNKRNRIMPCVAILDGEYGQNDIAMGVPCVLGEGGLRNIVELKLNNEEQAGFDKTIGQLRADVEELKNLGL